MGPFSSFGGYDISGLWIFLKIISALLSMGFIGGTIYAWMGYQDVTRLKEQKRADYFSRTKKQTISPKVKHWQTIVELFHTPDPNAWRVAIIDADAMMEDMITQMGFDGNTFGDKLKAMNQARIPWVDTAWDVHLLRNKLAHEGSRYHLNNREAYRAFKIYENLLHETGYLAKS